MTAAGGLPLWNWREGSIGLLLVSDGETPSVYVIIVVSRCISRDEEIDDLPQDSIVGDDNLWVWLPPRLLVPSIVGDDRGRPPGVLEEYSELLESVLVRGMEQLRVFMCGEWINGEDGGVSM